MIKYKSDINRNTIYRGYQFKEESDKIEEAVDNEEVAEIIAKLRDESFGNEEQRKRLIDLLTTLMMVKDPSARKLFKMVGHALSDIGSNLLGDSDEVSEYETDFEVEDEPMEIEPEMDYEEEESVGYQGPLVLGRYESTDRKLNEKETSYVKKLIDQRNKIHETLYNFFLETQKGFTGGKDSKNNKAVKELWSWSKNLLDKEFDFVKFIKTTKDISI